MAAGLFPKASQAHQAVPHRGVVLLPYDQDFGFGNGNPLRVKALTRINENIRIENREIATVLCQAMDAFRESPSPSLLQVLLDVLRDGQMTCEEEARRLQGIDNRRRRHYRGLGGGGPAYGPAIGAQYALARERARLVEVRRRLLRCIGDGVAWVLLGGNPRIVAPLYAPQTHQIPRGEGLAGVLLIQEALHRSGRFFVLENDLVRCIGIGDALVLAAGQLGRPPLVLEIKSSGEMQVGAELGVAIGSAHSNHPDHERLFREVTEVLETSESKEVLKGNRAERQMQHLGDRTQQVFQLTHSGAHVLRRPQSPHWRCIQHVIDRALAAGQSFDIAEEGVFKWAVRAHPEDDPEGQILAVHRKIYTLAGISEDRPHATSSTADLIQHEHLSAIVRPVVLWDIPTIQRAAILAEEVMVGNVRRLGILEQHLQAAGITAERHEGGLWIGAAGEERFMNSLEVAHMETSIALTGLSIRDVAAVIIEGFAASS